MAPELTVNEPTLWDRRWELSGVALAAGGVVVLVWLVFLRGIYFARLLAEQPLGTPRAQVERVMGTPDAIGTEFRLAQKSLYEDQYREAVQSGATEYWTWEYLLDVVCCAGFDTNGLLVVRHCGTT